MIDPAKLSFLNYTMLSVNFNIEQSNNAAFDKKLIKK